MRSKKTKNPSLLDMENENEKNLSLPTELIIEILLRLPVRSLLRFRRVCTSWSSLISDPQFAESHFDLNAAPTDRLLLRFINENRARVQSFDLASSLRDRSAVKTLNFPSPSMSCDHNPIHFLGSCRGFMLLAYERTSDFIVWNPTTGFDKQIQHFESDFMSASLHGFGYDKSTDDYFVVLIRLLIRANQAEIQAFSLKSESWHVTKSVNSQYVDHGDDFSSGVFLNDSLHWLVAPTARDTNAYVVAAFDLVEKSLSEIEIPLSPNLAAFVTGKVYHLRVLGECLSVCSSGGHTYGRADIWVMKKYKVQASWTKTFVISSCHIPCRHFYPVCFVEGGGVVGTNGRGTLMKFSSKGELLEHHKYDREYKKVLKYFEMYRESLLLFPGEQRPILCATSLPGDFKEATEEDEEKAFEDEEAIEDEYASGDEEDDATDDSNASEGGYPTEDEEDATEDEEEGETENDDDDDDDDGDDNEDEDEDDLL
ncbi:F-box/kelch-repeat protein At3g23880-like [Lotus japonicus]|uniref:F-box/kelch-repeat protein At3g23880-like n=1 Tax=Lotus japonicus TaxID=34305 RepID=UPI00258E95D0|nr:F-box/kelch-repeat protein At3g23880-like [Lotus japonicus]